MACMEKKHEPQESRTDHAKHSRFHPFDFPSPPGSAAVATSHGDAAIRKPPRPFPRPCAHCRRDDSSLEQYSGTDLPRLAGLQNGTCSSYLPHCPLGPKPGETKSSCRDVDMAFGRRSLGCSGLQQTRASSQYAGTWETLLKVSLSTPRMSVVDRHGQASWREHPCLDKTNPGIPLRWEQSTTDVFPARWSCVLLAKTPRGLWGRCSWTPILPRARVRPSYSHPCHSLYATP